MESIQAWNVFCLLLWPLMYEAIDKGIVISDVHLVKSLGEKVISASKEK